MTAESNPSKRNLLVPLLAVGVLGIALRFFFVDALTKLTGTWIGGVESPHRPTPTDDTVSTAETVSKGGTAPSGVEGSSVV